MPKLGDVQSTKVFRPGDRVLVRVYCSLDRNQTDRLVRSVQKFTGEYVRILIINAAMTEIKLIRAGAVSVLVEMRGVEDPLMLGVANVDCSVVDLQKDDKLVVRLRDAIKDPGRYLGVLKEWCGQDVEIVLVGWNRG